MLKLKLQYFDSLMRRVVSLEKTDAGRDWGQEEKGTTEDEMAGWHHWLDGRESEWTPGVGDVQGGLACCDSWGRKESDTTEQLNWTEKKSNFNIKISSLFYDYFKKEKTLNKERERVIKKNHRREKKTLGKREEEEEQADKRRWRAWMVCRQIGQGTPREREASLAFLTWDKPFLV